MIGEVELTANEWPLSLMKSSNVASILQLPDPMRQMPEPNYGQLQVVAARSPGLSCIYLAHNMIVAGRHSEIVSEVARILM